MTDERQISYQALEKGAHVVDSSGGRLGTVEHVLSDASLDLFDGIVVRTVHGVRFVEADSVSSITPSVVYTTVTSVDDLLKPAGDAVLEADPEQNTEGLSGWFGRMFLREHWVRDKSQGE